MTTRSSGLLIRRVHRRYGAVAATSVALCLSLTVASFAYWTASGGGTASAAAATLAAPSSVTASSAGSSVSVGFTGVTPPGGTLTGYYVTRHAGVATADACGTAAGLPASYLPAAATSCTDTAVPIGTYAYTVTAVFRTWTAQSTPSTAVIVNSDSVAPTQNVTLTSGTGSAALVGSTVYYRGNAAGTFTLNAAVTDSGSGPLHVEFPAIGTAGWTHAAQTVTTGTGAAPTVTYTSSPYSWTASPSNPAAHTVTGSDVAGNTVGTALTFAADNSGPTGGALAVNGVVAVPGGASGYSTTGTFSGVRTDYTTDTGSGLVSSILTRQAAALTNGTCGAFGASTTVSGAPSESALPTGCYRYLLTGTDAVGNSSALSATVLVDPAVPTLVLTAAGGAAIVSGSSLFYRSDVAGSLTLSAAVSDAQSGPASASFPAVTGTGWTHPAQTVTSGTGAAPTVTYVSSAYSWTASATATAPLVVTAADVAGNTSSASSSFTLLADASSPTGGTLTVNGTAGSAAGTSSASATGAWTVSTTSFTDTGSGIATQVLTVATANLSGASGGACGTFGAATDITGTTSVSGQSGGQCLRYTWTATDNVGHVTSLSTTVRSSPYVVSASLQNGSGNNVAGKIEQNDKVVIVFSDAMAASSICSAWTSNTQNYTLQVTDSDATLVDGGAAADSMSFSVGAGCGGGINIGSIALGSTGYNTTGSDITYGKNGKPKRTVFAWAFATSTLTITLGDESVATAGTVAGASAFTYTPAAAITNSGNVPIGGFLSGTGVLF